MLIIPRQTNLAGVGEDVKNSFSSWDSCMSKAYCKWPVIVGIIIGSLIALTVLSCLMRCICCGKDIVCCCFRCCGRNKGHKHLDSAPPTPYNNQYNNQFNQQNRNQPYQQYQSHAPPVYAGPAAFAQTATFESPTGKIHDDSLPAMPSWETATSRKVEVIEEPPAESHEMDHLHGDHYDSAAMRSGSTSPLPRPIPMRNGSHPSTGSLPGSPRIPTAAGYGAERNPYGDGQGFHGSRTDLRGSNANFNSSRTNLTAENDYAYRGTGGPSPNPPLSARPYGNSPYDSRSPGGNDGGYKSYSPVNAPASGGSNDGGYKSYNPANASTSGGGGYKSYSPVSTYGNSNPGNDHYGSSSHVNDRYGSSNPPGSSGNPYGASGSANDRFGGGNAQYPSSPYDRRPPGGNQWRDI